MTLQLRVPTRFQEGVSNFLMERGASGLEEMGEGATGVTLKAYFPGEENEMPVLEGLSRYLKSIQRIDRENFAVKIHTRILKEQDWGETWKRHFKPVRVGLRFIVFPPWEKIKPIRGQVPMEINPGMAFGTGTHATTRLCLIALERRVRRGMSVLDVGTGSGILAIAAAKLGARWVRGLDVDPVAVEAAGENIIKNGVADAVRVRRGGIGRISGLFDMIVANIDFKALTRLAHPLADRLGDGGILILSGLLAEQGKEIRQSYLKTGMLRLVDQADEDEWVCLIFKGKKKTGR